MRVQGLGRGWAAVYGAAGLGCFAVMAQDCVGVVVGPPGSRLPLQPPGSGTSTICHLRWQEELDEFHELWREQRGRRDHCGDGFASRCLDGWPTAIDGQKFESEVCEIHN